MKQEEQDRLSSIVNTEISEGEASGFYPQKDKSIPLVLGVDRFGLFLTGPGRETKYLAFAENNKELVSFYEQAYFTELKRRGYNVSLNYPNNTAPDSMN